nr:retrovirus-related Pol polyprotein from transposon TNT 1-94 [Tanacetum cinerariifolium]
KPDISFLYVFDALCYPKNDREDIGKLGAKVDIGFFIGYSANSCAFRVYNRRTKKIIETMNVTFDELSIMAFEQRSSKPGLQTMYNEYIGGQPSTSPRIVPAAQAHQIRQTPTTSTSIADTAPTPTNSSSQATNFPNTSLDVNGLNSQQQHAQQQGYQALIQPETIADNVPNAMFDANTLVKPFATPSTSAAESSSSQYVDPSNMHTFYQPYPHEFQWTKDHPLEQVIGEPSRLVLTRNQLRSNGDMCMYTLTVSTIEPKNVKEAMIDSAWIESMQEELLQFKRLDDSGFELTRFSDVDYSGCKDTFKSTSDGAQFLREKLVSWSSKKQDCMALSTAEAEYVSLSACSIAISCNLVQLSRTKHIVIRYHFIKEHVKKGSIELYFVKTDYQLDDIFTKALLVDRFNYLVRRLGIPTASYEDPTARAFCHFIEFGDSYKAPLEESGKGPVSESSAKEKGRTVVITTEDMQKKRNDVKARTTLLLALPDEHQLRFSKLQAIVSHLEFMDVEIEQDDLNQKFLTSLAPEWLIGKGEIHTVSVPTAGTQVSTASTNVVAASLSHDTVCAYIASQSNGSHIKYENITQIDEDDIEEMDIKWNMALLSMRVDMFWKKTESAEHLEVKTESFMANEEENHALVADDEVPTEFALMAKSSSSSENKVEARLVEFKEQEIKFLEKIRGLERDVEVRNNKIKYLMNKLEHVKKEKEGLDNKLTGLPEFVDDTVTDYSRPTPSIDESKCNTSDL